jgi:RNA methyltransferase, TrmH family
VTVASEHGEPGEASVSLITSSSNPLIKELRELSQDSTAYRKQGRIWLEGDHLCRAALQRGLKPALGVFSKSFWPLAQAKWAREAIKNIAVPDTLMRDISGLESPAQMGFVIDLPPSPVVQVDASSVILDRVQDAGNVGSILRSAAAFGIEQVLAIKGTAALWSPKVLRAGMGAHFGLRLIESIDPVMLDALAIPIIVTSSHEGAFIHEAALPATCAWVLGHEGQGVGEELMARGALKVRIAQPGGEESLNVASAAAICLYASSLANQRNQRGSQS